MKKVTIFSMTTALILLLIISFQGSADNITDNSQIVVLTYHQLTTEQPESSAVLNIDDFASQMEYLYQNNYRTLSLQELKKYHQQGSFPANAVLITFDDGYRTFYTKALPVLEKYNLQAVVFPIVSHLSKITPRKLWSEPLYFQDLRDMETNSELVEIGSHTYDLHHYRDEQPVLLPKEKETPTEYIARIRKDLQVSKELLELQLDKNIIALSWPYGRYNETSQKIAKTIGFKLLFTTESRPFTTEDKLTEIPRYSVSEGELDYFKSLLEDLE